MSYVEIAKWLAVGLTMGLGAVGSALGEGYAAGRALEGLARQPGRKDTITNNMILGQAISETSAIFSLIIALILLNMEVSGDNLAQAAAILGTGLAIGLGAMGAGIGDGRVAGLTNNAIATNPECARSGVKVMILGQALCETSDIFALVISFVLMSKIGDAAKIVSTPEQLMTAGRYLGAGLCMGFGAIGPAIGTGIAGGSAAEGVVRHPESDSIVTRSFLIGAGVSQTTGIYAMIVALLLISTN